MGAGPGPGKEGTSTAWGGFSVPVGRVRGQVGEVPWIGGSRRPARRWGSAEGWASRPLGAASATARLRVTEGGGGPQQRARAALRPGRPPSRHSQQVGPVPGAGWREGQARPEGAAGSRMSAAVALALAAALLGQQRGPAMSSAGLGPGDLSRRLGSGRFPAAAAAPALPRRR